MIQNVNAKELMYMQNSTLFEFDYDPVLANERIEVEQAINEFRSENKACFFIHKILGIFPYQTPENTELFYGANDVAQDISTNMADGTKLTYSFPVELNEHLIDKDNIAATSINKFHWTGSTYQEALYNWFHTPYVCDTIMQTGLNGAGIGLGKVASGADFHWTLVIFQISPLDVTIPTFKTTFSSSVPGNNQRERVNNFLRVQIRN